MQAIKNTIAENFGGPSHNLAEKKFNLDDVPDLSGKVAVVTGGSEGILLNLLPQARQPPDLQLEVNRLTNNRGRFWRNPHPSF